MHFLARFVEEKPKIDDDDNNNDTGDNSKAVAKNGIYSAAAAATTTFTAASTSLTAFASRAHANYEAAALKAPSGKATQARTVRDLLITRDVSKGRSVAPVESATATTTNDTHSLATHIATQQMLKAQQVGPQQQAALPSQLSIAMFAQIL